MEKLRGGEVLGDGLAHVGERAANAKIGACAMTRLHARRIANDRDVLARMVGRRIHGIGIAAVIRGEEEKVGTVERCDERAEELVEFFE